MHRARRFRLLGLCPDDGRAGQPAREARPVPPPRPGRQISRGLFLDASWIAVYLGQRIFPQGHDMRAEAPPADALAREMAALHHEIKATAEAMPDHVGHISRYCPMARLTMDSRSDPEYGRRRRRHRRLVGRGGAEAAAAGLSVTIVPVPPPADALADRIAAPCPRSVEFHADIGLIDADAMVRAGSGFRLGTCFDGWAEGRRPMSTRMANMARRSAPPPSISIGSAPRSAPRPRRSTAIRRRRRSRAPGRFAQPRGRSLARGWRPSGTGCTSIPRAIAR